MTVIVGVEHNGGSTIAADSLSASPAHCHRSGASKIVRHEKAGLLIGFTTAWRFGQLLRYELDPPKHWQDEAGKPDADEWVATELAKAIKKTLVEAEWATKENERREGGFALIAYRGRIYRLQDEFDIVRTGEGYDAVGAGDSIALGALYALAGRTEGASRARAAVEAACRHSPWCGGPIEAETLAWSDR